MTGEKLSHRGDRTVSFALVWSFVTVFGDQAITLVVTFLLARALGPEVFGLAALAIVYVLFVEMLLKQGMTAAIIHRPQLSATDLDTAFWMVLGATVAFSVATFGLAGLWADLNHAPELQAPTIVLGLMVPIRGMTVVQDALLRRGLEFRSLAGRYVVAAAAGGAVALTLAHLGAGVWALIVQQIVVALVDLVVLWRVSHWRPGWSWSSRSARELLAFAAPNSAATMGLFASERSDTVVTSVYFGQIAVGLHRFAIRFVDIVVTMFSGPFLQVALPAFAREQDDRRAFAARVADMFRMSAAIAFPVFAGLAAGGGDLVALAGEEWLPARIPLVVLCAAGMARALNFYNAPVMQAVGRTRLLAGVEWSQAVAKTATVIAVGAALRDAHLDDQILALAIAIAVLESFFLFGVAVPIVRHISGFGWRGVAATISRPILAAVSAVVIVDSLRGVGLFDPVPLLVRVGVTGGLGVLVAAGLELATDRRLRAAARERLVSAIGRRRVGEAV